MLFALQMLLKVVRYSLTMRNVNNQLMIYKDVTENVIH